MPKFQRRPTIVEAEQWFPGKDVPGVIQEVMMDGPGKIYERHFVVTIQGQRAYLTPGDWIIPESGDPDRHYPCAAAVFEATYMPMVEPCA